MTLNDLLTRQNVFTKIILKDGDKELSKELKVKVMRIRMAYNKIKKNFDEEVKEFTEQIITEELRELSSKTDRTEQEEKRFQELNNKANLEYQEFLIQKGNEEISDPINDRISVDEYSDIVDVNSGNNIEINGNTIKAADFLETIYDLFAEE